MHIEVSQSQAALNRTDRLLECQLLTVVIISRNMSPVNHSDRKGAFQSWGRFPKSPRGVSNWHFLAPQAGLERFLACLEARWQAELPNSPH